MQGSSLDQIVNTVLAVEETKKQRRESLRMNQWEKLNFAVDKAGRTLRKIVRPKSNKNEEKTATASVHVVAKSA
jgi:hypothetical protein